MLFRSEQVAEATATLQNSVAAFTAVLGGVRFTVGSDIERASVNRLVVPVWLAIAGGQVTRRQLIRYTDDVANETLSRDLKRLASMDLLSLHGKGRGAHYVPGPAIESWGPFDALVGAAKSGGVAAVLELLNGRSTPSLF